MLLWSASIVERINYSSTAWSSVQELVAPLSVGRFGAFFSVKLPAGENGVEEGWLCFLNLLYL